MENVPKVSRGTHESGGRQVLVETTVPDASAQNRDAKKLIVAVHGVGDQLHYATLQAVFNQFCRYYEEPSGVPLGAFHNQQSTFSTRS